MMSMGPALQRQLGQPLDIPMGILTALRVKVGHHTLNAAVKTVRKADRLYVTFHGTRRSPKGETTTVQAPLFWSVHRHELFEAPVLAISDPLAERIWGAGRPRIATYFGTFAHDLLPELNALVDQVCDELGVDRGDAIMYGVGTGGAAALLAAAARSCKARAIAVSPQLRLDTYPQHVIALAARAMGGSAEQWRSTIATQPHRMNPLAAMRNAVAHQPDFRAVVAHNALDLSVGQRQWSALRRKFRLPQEGGLDPTGRILALQYQAPDLQPREDSQLTSLLLKLAAAHFEAGFVVDPSRRINVSDGGGLLPAKP